MSGCSHATDEVLEEAEARAVRDSKLDGNTILVFGGISSGRARSPSRGEARRVFAVTRVVHVVSLNSRSGSSDGDEVGAEKSPA